MKTIAAIVVGALAGWILLASPALDGAGCAASSQACSPIAPRSTLVTGLLIPVGEAFPPPSGEPSYEELWISRERLQHLAKYHGTQALKITGTRVYIWRGDRWLQVEAL